MSMRNLLLCAMITLGPVALPAAAQVSVNIEIGVPPPPLRYEVVPAPRPGYIWAPGYWQWEGQRHVWASGRWVAAQPGSYWVADSWEPRNGRHHFKPGHWERGPDHDNGKGKGHDNDKGKGKGHDKG